MDLVTMHRYVQLRRCCKGSWEGSIRLCELRGNLPKLELRSGGINDNQQADQIGFLTNSNNSLSQRTCPLKSCLLVHEPTIRQQSSG
jgi:hypothetical protein